MLCDNHTTYWHLGRNGERGFVLYISWILAGIKVVGGCVLVNASTHIQITWVFDVSPGVGRTPEEPEEFRSTKAQYTCRLYRCTKYISAGKTNVR